MLTHKPRTAGGIGAGMAASRRSTLAPLNHVLRDPAGAVCSGSRHHSTADQPWWVEVVGGGVFCRQPACFCKREATDRAPADSTLAGRGKPNRSRRVFVS